jgi:hypothetical protein
MKGGDHSSCRDAAQRLALSKTVRSSHILTVLKYADWSPIEELLCFFKCEEIFLSGEQFGKAVIGMPPVYERELQVA